MRTVRKGGRPKQRDPLPTDLARKMIRQHKLTGSWLNLAFAVSLFGERTCAEELMRRYKEECERAGHRYRRDDAIDEAARLVRMDRDKLANWVNRSKRTR
jgi:hypothetical protein